MPPGACVLVNGAFGVGKTAVARELRRQLPGSVLFDPEKIGFVLSRLPGYRRSDYQHLSSWRRLTVLGGRLLVRTRALVIVPMAFSELRYLDEVRGGLAGSGGTVLHFCLTAPLSVVRERLAGRGEPPDDPRWAWVHRRAAECCEAHASPGFAERIATEGAPPDAIARELAVRIRSALASAPVRRPDSID